MNKNKKRICKNCKLWKKPFVDGYGDKWGECTKPNLKTEVFIKEEKKCNQFK